jgi:polysaccharide biosynthesis protein PslH
VRILFVCHRIPYPPDKGDKIRAFHELQALASKHEVDLFTLIDDARDSIYQSDLLAWCRRIVVSRIYPAWARIRSLPFVFSRKPLTLPYFYAAKLQLEVHRAIGRHAYDRIFVYCSAMGQYVESIAGIPKITDLVDVDSDKWSQYARASRFPFAAVYSREARRLQQYERQICQNSACVLVSTPREEQLARQIAPDGRLHVVLNGVDTEYFQPLREISPSGPSTIVFTGDMSYFPNQDAVIHFARKVLPIIRQSTPEARFVIIGRNPSRSVQDLRRMEGVTVTGWVPDVRIYLAGAHVSVAPFAVASGVQNKILEAMAFGLPVVATPRALQGLSTRVSEVIHTGSKAEEFAREVTGLLRDRDLARRDGLEGRRRVAAAYSWDRTHARVLELVENPKGTEATTLQAQTNMA